MVAWRAAGINYVRFSQIAAQVTRQCSKVCGEIMYSVVRSSVRVGGFV
ncbi:unnamed protein product [Angiostrongylus costaricensis]|uniref:ATP synthase F1 subunit epsilon n=1 Tax=Angiostrongylus costaricensis TaxID=334426 RepID=A0A0R3PTC7_ANGCS|nr:unnamed protein product [Angiostrongylus costaricensis]